MHRPRRGHYGGRPPISSCQGHLHPPLSRCSGSLPPGWQSGQRGIFQDAEFCFLVLEKWLILFCPLKSLFPPMSSPWSPAHPAHWPVCEGKTLFCLFQLFLHDTWCFLPLSTTASTSLHLIYQTTCKLLCYFSASHCHSFF